MTLDPSTASGGARDWLWKLQKAVERIKNDYEHIGRGTGAPFLAIVFPPAEEAAVLKEWRALEGLFGPDYEISHLNILEITTSVLEEMGVDNIVESIQNPMPGSNPESELAGLWLSSIVREIKNAIAETRASKPVIVLTHLAALYPATGPNALMHALRDSKESIPENPIIFLIPGQLIEARVYEFLNRAKELMYRGDIL